MLLTDRERRPVHVDRRAAPLQPCKRGLQEEDAAQSACILTASSPPARSPMAVSKRNPGVLQRRSVAVPGVTPMLPLLHIAAAGEANDGAAHPGAK